VDAFFWSGGLPPTASSLGVAVHIRLLDLGSDRPAWSKKWWTSLRVPAGRRAGGDYEPEAPR